MENKVNETLNDEIFSDEKLAIGHTDNDSIVTVVGDVQMTIMKGSQFVMFMSVGKDPENRFLGTARYGAFNMFDGSFLIFDDFKNATEDQQHTIDLLYSFLRRVRNCRG